MSFPLAGTLDDIPISELMIEIRSAKLSGVLEVVRGKLRRQVAFHEGRAIAIQSNAMSESLLKLLESAQRITSDDVKRFRQEAARTKQPPDILLIREGVLKKDELPKLRAALNQLRLVGLYSCKDGHYRVSKKKIPPGPELPVPTAVMQFVRRSGDSAGLLRSLEPRRRERPRAVPEPPFPLNQFGLDQAEREFYESLDGTRELGEILAFSGLPPQSVAKLIIVFTLTGMIEDAGQAVAPSPGRREPTTRKRPQNPPEGAIAAPPPEGAIAAPPPEGAIAAPPPEGAIAAPPPDGAGPVTSRPVAVPVAPAVGPEGGTAGEPAVGRYVMRGGAEPVPGASSPVQEAGAPDPTQPPESSAPGASRAEVSGGGLSIEDMIAEEVGELDEAEFVPVKLEHDPLLDFNMSGFTPRERDIANQFKETYINMHKQNYFEIFGLDRRAKAADIRKAYFNLAKEYHTDRLVKFPEPIQKLGTEIFNRMQKAYDTLTDPEAREKYVDATFYGKAHDEEAAIEEVQAVLEADRHFKTGIGLLNAGNLPGAHKAFARARDLYPKEPEYNACYGYTLFRMNYPRDKAKWEEGEKILHTAVRKNPKLDRANLFLGRVYLAKNDHRLAARYFVRALKTNPSNLEAGRELQQLRARREEKSAGLFSSFLDRFKK